MHPIPCACLRSPYRPRPNAFLWEELRTRSNELAEQRRIIAGLVQRVPELEAPVERRDAKETVSEDSGNDGGGRGSVEPTERRSWWKRFFGF